MDLNDFLAGWPLAPKVRVMLMAELEHSVAGLVTPPAETRRVVMARVLVIESPHRAEDDEGGD